MIEKKKNITLPKHVIKIIFTFNTLINSNQCDIEHILKNDFKI
jgi:hypothetical protein